MVIIDYTLHSKADIIGKLLYIHINYNKYNYSVNISTYYLYSYIEGKLEVNSY